MAGNSRADILAKMQLGTITEGWGAITVFNRTRLNRILLQQWIEKYDGSGYMPPFSGRAYTTELKTEYSDLNDIVLASPRLSFDSQENADFSNSSATLTLSILSGTYTAYAVGDGFDSVLYSYTIQEAHGYTLTINVDLAMVSGEVDELGRVVLDLSKGTKIECNLAGPKVARLELGKYFQQRFNELPPHRRVFELGMLDLKGYNPLTPKRFEIRTQQAPGGNDVMSSTYGDGAVVVFIQLKASEFGGGMPPSHFPYLIPNDQDDQGDKYSATLILAKEFVKYADRDKLTLIHSLLFPGENNIFVELDRATTSHDMAVFGNINPSKTAITIDPPLHSMKAGSRPFQYQALRDGKPLSGVIWSVRSLNTQGSAGQIVQNTGLYTPVALERAGRETVRNVVTATYTDAATQQTYRVSSLLLVTSEPMAISPTVTRSLLSGAQQPITFVASAVSGAGLSWSQPEYGSLEVNGNTAIYTPPATPLPEDVVVQAIEARNPVTGETVSASVVLFKYAPDFDITPGFTRGLGQLQTLQLKENDRKPDLKRRWTVIGEGSVTDGGLYMAPSQFSKPVDIVVCELLNQQGQVEYFGYGIVQLSNIVQELTWKSLHRFHIKKVVGRAYANGMQQMAVNILVKTSDVDSVNYPLNEDEVASLRLVDKATRDELPFVQGQNGIEQGSPLRWATNWTRSNRFTSMQGGNLEVASAQNSSSLGGVLNTDKTLYVHTRGERPTDTPPSTRFVASLIGSSGQGQFYSDLHPGENDTEDVGHVTLTPVPIPTKSPTDYTFKGARVAGGGAGGIGRPEGPGWDPLPPGEDDFDYFLKTIDYWRLEYKRGPDTVLFVRCNFKARQSLVKWESGYDNETMFSYTGYAFHWFAPGGESDPKNRTIEFDHALTYRPLPPELTPVEFENDQTPVSGELLITLTRADDVRRSTSGDLLPLNNVSMVVDLLDAEGNPHSLDLKFASDNRNKLELRVLT
jgi:hypothetical protein